MSRTSGSTRRSSKKKEFESRLAAANCKRGLIFSAVLSALLPLYWVMCNSTGDVAVGYTAMVIVAETIELASTVILLYIVKNAIQLSASAGRLYYLFTAAVMTPLCIMDYGMSGSIMLFVMFMGALSVVPCFSRGEMNVYSVTMIAAGIAMTAAAAADGVREAVGTGVISVAAVAAGRYIQELFRSRERIKGELKEKTFASEQDPLTGLTNRRGFIRRAGVIWPISMRSHVMVGVIAIDIDFFKKYNDKFGHPEGDECLKKIAGAIEDSARRQTDIVVRTGGEEFLVFVQNMNKKEIIGLALKIRSAVADLRIEHAYVEVSQYVTVSMGVACTYPDTHNSVKELYEEADQALYMAKENGRNCVVCDGSMYGRMKNGLGTAIGS